MVKTLKITILGDILYQKELDFTNNKSFLKDVEKYLKESDYVIGNLETPVSKDKKDLKTDRYCFTAPIGFAEVLKKSGIDFVSTANNHCLDNGIEGINKTIEALDEVGLEHTGTFVSGKEDFIKEIDGKKIGVISYTYGTNAFSNNVYLKENEKYKVNLSQEQEKSNNRYIEFLRMILGRIGIKCANKPVYERNFKSHFKDLENDVLRLSKKCDYLILMLHDGGQGNKKPIKRVLKNAKKLDALTNKGMAIIYNHEHMIHEIRHSGKNIITFSIGNFVGANGTLIEPFDKNQEYSIGINVYLSDDEPKYSYVVFKNVVENGKLKVKKISEEFYV